jgi:Fe2+ transport system protein FeoA
MSVIPTPAPIRIPLTQLRRGDRAVVELGALEPDESKLLEAMGLANEAEVRVCRSGSMCIVQIEATRLGISAAMAARILARPCECHGIGENGAPIDGADRSVAARAADASARR